MTMQSKESAALTQALDLLQLQTTQEAAHVARMTQWLAELVSDSAVAGVLARKPELRERLSSILQAKELQLDIFTEKLVELQVMWNGGEPA